jgi:protein-L-isoaspartate(D-aspartate) O-methyltransferase
MGATVWTNACCARSPGSRTRRFAWLLVPLLGVTTAVAQEGDPYHEQRERMADLIYAYGVTDSATQRAMRTVPRHEFVPREHLRRAYGDHPLPIEHGQTISQPYIVAYMTEVLGLSPGMKVLEVGTGSGYQAAVLGEVGVEVHTLEIFGALAASASARLERLGYVDVAVHHADGHFGWLEEAPFDAVIVTAAPTYIPVEQLVPGGRMVIPVGSVYGAQNLILILKDDEGEVTTRSLMPVRFVPMLQGLR